MCSSLRNISVRSLEREIGNYKKKIRARVNVEANALNVLERVTRFKFLDTTGLIDFSVLYNRNPNHSKRGFTYHPAASHNPDCHNYPQLWEPFSLPISISDHESSISIEDLIQTDKFFQALCGYKRRFLGISRAAPLELTVNEAIIPAAKLWSDSHILISALFKSRSKAFSSNNRGGEYVLFESNVRKRYIQINCICHKITTLTFCQSTE